MNRILILALALMLAGCAGNRDADRDFHVTLIHKSPGQMLLQISRREPVTVTGPDGYTGVRKITYWAALPGGGTTFTDPHFADNPPNYHCKGTIMLDLEHNVVQIDMQRIVSKPGEPEETKPHPANGMHRIEKIRRGKPGDWWF